jgi:hypothetical protein
MYLKQRVYLRANKTDTESDDHDADIVEETFEKIHEIDVFIT